MAALRPADLLVVRTSGLAAAAIRFGAALTGAPNISNHVVLAHHMDAQGRWWGLEGRPGGVGWADLRGYLDSNWTLNNILQPARPDAGRQRVCDAALAMLGTPYDWDAIADDTLRAFHMHDLWSKDWGGKAPGHVVCSAFTSYLYHREGWARPPVADRDTEPADWDAFIIQNRYSQR